MTVQQQGNVGTVESARAVVYARYSTELQSDTSVDDQVRLCRDFIHRQGWLPLHVYSDRAMSGASALRPGNQRLLEDARAGRFDFVVAEALDRLTRDQADTATLYKQPRLSPWAKAKLPNSTSV